MEFLLHQFVLKREQTVLSSLLLHCHRINVKIFLESRNGCQRLALIQSRLGRAHVKALTDKELCHFCIFASGIGRVVLLEILCSRFIVLVHILGHSKHVETFLAILLALHHRHDAFKQCNGAGVLTTGKTFLRILVFILIVIGFVDTIELLSTTRHEQKERSRQYDKNRFFHFKIRFELQKYTIFGKKQKHLKVF